MRICVFCGSSAGVQPEYKAAAASVGALLARKGIGLVYGGANVGLMGVIADSALAAGGEVIGVMPDSLVAKEVAHRRLRDLRIVSSMHERKALMAELSDAFIALPGGYGTLEEFCEVLTWSQLGIHRKACGLLNTCGYYDGLLALLDHAVAERFLKPVNRGLVLSDTNPERLIERVLEYDVPLVPKWVDRTQA
ncbi:MAG TPA: TIGR00730 family Rossman fold protein [Bryobacteraceae bacterium]